MTKAEFEVCVREIAGELDVFAHDFDYSTTGTARIHISSFDGTAVQASIERVMLDRILYFMAPVWMHVEVVR